MKFEPVNISQKENVSIYCLLSNDLLAAQLLSHLSLDCVLALDSTCRLARRKAIQHYWSFIDQLKIVFKFKGATTELLTGREMCFVADVNGVGVPGVLAEQFVQSILARLALLDSNRIKHLAIESEFFLRRNDQLNTVMATALRDLIRCIVNQELVKPTTVSLSGVFLVKCVMPILLKKNSPIINLKLCGNSWVPPLLDPAVSATVPQLPRLESLELNRLGFSLKSIEAMLTEKQDLHELIVRETCGIFRHISNKSFKFASMAHVIYQQQGYSDFEFSFDYLHELCPKHFPQISRLGYFRSLGYRCWQGEDDFDLWAKNINQDLPNLLATVPTLRVIELGQIETDLVLKAILAILHFRNDLSEHYQILITCLSFSEKLVGAKQLRADELTAYFVSVLTRSLADKRILVRAASKKCPCPCFYNEITYTPAVQMPAPVTIEFESTLHHKQMISLTFHQYSIPIVQRSSRAIQGSF